ncbi:recombinase RecA [Pantoea ananatis]|nr:recombinase RecA [Pantoea ananatis]QKV90210.1 recombinase RecA [Pantoea ananatis]
MGIDWDNPSWYSGGKVHNWHNYAPPELQEIWNTFTQDQKKAIAFALDECAGNEQWE